MLTTASVSTESVNHVFMPLANQVIRHILQEIGMLEYFDNKIYVNSALHNPSKSYDQNLNPILVEDKVKCVFDIKHSSLGLAWESTTVTQHMDGQFHRRDRLSTLPILMDKRHGITLYDSVLPFNLPMNCTISSRDYVRAHEIIDRFHLKFNKGELISIANLTYNFPLPFEIVQALWALASTIGIDRKCFPVWLEQYSNGAIKRIETKGLKNKRVEWVVNRSVFETLVKLDFDVNMDPEKEGQDQAETLGLNFTATLHASRPSVLYVDYPIIVNNTLVPPQIIKVDTSYQRELYRMLGYSRWELDPTYQESKFLVDKPVQNPWYDNWQVPTHSDLHSSLKSTILFIGAFTLDIPECKNCPCKADPDANPYEDHACCHHSWIEQRSPNYYHDCNDCPYHKRTPYEEECPCYCQKIATTDIDIDNDLDMYKLSDKVRLYFRIKKRKALLVESVYNVTVYIDNMMMNPEDLEFDGKILKVTNKFGPDHIYRMVVSYTPRRKMEYSQQKSIEGYDPYAVPYCIIPKTGVTRLDAKELVADKYNSSSADSSVSFDKIGNSIIPAKEMEGYIQKAVEIAKDEETSDRITLELKNEIFDEKNSEHSNSTIMAIAESISSEFEKYDNDTPKVVVTLAKKFNVFLPEINTEAAKLLLVTGEVTEPEELKEALTEYVQENYSFDEDVASALTNEVANRYIKADDITEAADTASDYYALGVNSYFVSTNTEAPKNPVMLILDCIIASNKENKNGNE